jgi:hypothetical protein
MNPPAPPDSDARIERAHASSTRGKLLALVGLIAGFVLWAHLGSGIPAFRSEVSSEPGWERFRADFRINHFGDDGQFVRAVQNGYNLVFYTYKYAPRFTRKSARDSVNSCAACHTAEDIAYGLVNSDRFDPKLGNRVSFEERVMRCYAGPMDGFIPTLYDPAVRDIRLFARAVAHHLQLSEGALRKGN